MGEYDDYINNPTPQIEGPTYKDGNWTARFLQGEMRQTFHGKTQKEVQEQLIAYLDQLERDYKKARMLLRAFLENPDEEVND